MSDDGDLAARVEANIVPVFQEVAEQLLADGHFAKFWWEGSSAGLDFQPRRRPGRPPQLLFALDGTEVTVHEITKQGSRIIEQFSLDHLSRDAVRAKTLNWVDHMIQAPQAQR
jgi:hypothetical protein